MKESLVGLAFLAMLSAAGIAEATTPEGRVVYVESYKLQDSLWEWGSIVLRPKSGPWLMIWIKSSVPEETARQLFELAGHAPPNHTLTFVGAKENPYWPYYFSVDRNSYARVWRWGDLPDARLSELSNVVTFSGQIQSITIYFLWGTWVTLGRSLVGPSVFIPRSSPHYHRLLTAVIGGFDEDHEVTFHNLEGEGPHWYDCGEATSVNSYRARNQ